MYLRERLKSFLLSAMAYAYGYTAYRDILPIIEDPSLGRFTEQVRELKKKQMRTPKLVVDIGAGRGDLTATFLYDGVECIPVDPSPGPAEIIPETLEKWLGYKDTSILIKKRMYPALCEIKDAGLHPDTVILCATIEHIPEKEFYMSLPLISSLLSETNGLFIITSFIDYHPIDDPTWDHIHMIDDRTYGDVARVAKRLVFKQGSHLVVGW